MTLTFEAANKKYKEDAIVELSQSAAGRRFLLLRSLSRTEHLSMVKRFIVSAGVSPALFAFAGWAVAAAPCTH